MNQKLKKNIVLVIFVIGLASYVIYQFLDFTANSKNNRKYLNEFRPNYIKGLIQHSTTLSTLDSATAYEIANCFYDKFVQKYGWQKLSELDTRYASGDTGVYSQYVKPLIDSCKLPFQKKVKDAENLYGCIESIVKKGKHSKIQAKEFCICFFEKQKMKYGDSYNDSVANDSLLKIEVQESGCIDALK